MKRFLTSIFSAALLTATASAGTLPIYENFAFMTSGTNVPPQIDALAFANYGTFVVSTTLPFDFTNVRSYTNRGTMSGSPGFVFDTAFSNRQRVPAVNFVNASGATIRSVDGPPLGLGLNQTISPSYLNVFATNISVQGLLSVGAGGLLRLEGKDVNASRSGLEVRRIAASPVTPFVTPTDFYPDVGITDNYWALTNGTMQASTLLDMGAGRTNVSVPRHAVTNTTGRATFVSFQLRNPLSFVQTNKVTDTNWTVQAAFVGGNTNIDYQCRFANGQDPANPFKTIVFGMSMSESNVVTGSVAYNTLYLLDELATATNFVVLSNQLSAPVGTYRPANYILTRDPPNEFATGGSPSGNLVPDLFYSQVLSNNLITNIYSGYSAAISSMPIQPPQVSGFEYTNLPGRVEIKADNLDLSRTRIRGNAMVNIETQNLLSSTNAVVDSPNLNFNLGAIQRVLTVTNLAQETVPRLFGNLRAWSALWTNNSGSIVTNIEADPNDPTLQVTNLVTNVIEIAYHAFVLDTSQLQTEAPVVTHDLKMHAPDVILGDNLSVQRSFLVDASSFTLSGSLTLSDKVEYWRGANAPNLQHFTNNGTLSVANGAFFTDGRSPFTDFINAGLIQANGIKFETGYFENTGRLYSYSDGIRVQTDFGRVEGGFMYSAGDVMFTAADLKFFRSTNNIQRSLILNVSDGLGDAGAGSDNSWSVRNGFQLPIKPASGDLLGTTVRSFVPRFNTVQNIWAGENRGANASGYQNNAAIGALILAGDPDTVVQFSGVGANNALYVDYLVLTNTTLAAFESNDLGAAIEIDPGYVVYFASANVPAEKLNGQIGGRLVWVPSFVGPNSSVDILRRDGRTEQMNRAVRTSSDIDSDNDGLPNAFDPYPLDPEPPLTFTSVGVTAQPATVSFTWEAKAKTVYRVEYTSSLGSGDWQPLGDYTNSATTAQSAVMRDPVPGGAAQRYYRVRSVGQVK